MYNENPTRFSIQVMWCMNMKNNIIILSSLRIGILKKEFYKHWSFFHYYR
jgi:hypothetical protein